jgi:pilus assembly protein FimV
LRQSLPGDRETNNNPVGSLGDYIVRKLGLIITFWIGLLAFPLSSLALGLGEIEVDSYLNQPLKAEIPVVSARPGEVDDLLVSLASRDAFRKAGLERPAVLSQLRFKVAREEDGSNARILVTTKKPVKEPFLNFLVEADWAKGRLLREYTILLDPPVFAQQPAAPAPAAAARPEPAPAPEPVAEQEPAPAPAPIAMSEPEPEPRTQPEPAQPADGEIAYVPDSAYLADETTEATPAAGQTIVVQKGDTLWGIASGLKDGEHTMAQIMLALQQANPDAFGQNNINNLKVGAVLRIPDQEAFNTLSRQEAYAQVLEQNGLWDEYLARVSGKSSTAEPQAGMAATAGEAEAGAGETGGQLSLLAPGDGESDTAGLQDDAAAEDIDRIRKQLALAEEQLEATRLENNNLQSRVQDLELQLRKFEELQQKLMQLEDPALAQLQQNAAEDADTTVTAEVEKQQAPAEVTDAQDRMAEEMAAITGETTEGMDQAVETAEGMIEEAPAEGAGAMPQPMAEDGMMAGETPAEDGMTDESMAETPMDEGMQDGMMESARAGDDMTTEAPMQDGMIEETPMPESDEAGQPQAETPPAPVIVSEAPQGEGGLLDMLPSMDSLLGDPVMLGGVGAILALLLGLLFVRRKKSSEDDETGITLDVADTGIDDDQTPIHIPEVDETKGTTESTQIEMPGAEEPFTERTLEETAADLGVETEEYNAEELLDEVSLDDDNPFEQTAVLSADEMPQAEESEEQDDVLNEVDVYLAYGLYDNAEDLLKSSLDEHPTRADYRAKLLDTYYATKNRDAFIEEARKLQSLGGAADRFWDRVQVMGHELAPDEELFQGAENIDPDAVKIEYEKPETADFDLGADADATDFATDFDLGEENEDIADTLVVPEVPEEAEDKSADVDLSLDEDLSLDDEDALSFELPDEQEEQQAGEKIEDISELNLEETEEAPIPGQVPPMADDELNLSLGDDKTDLAALEAGISEGGEDEELPDSLDVDLDLTDVSAEEIIEDTELMQTPAEAVEEGVEEEGTRHVEAALDLDVSDEESDGLQSSTEDDITEFRPADMTGEFELPETAEEVEGSTVNDKTGTFAPGDFDDDVAADAADDIEDLMLPDDVDEVATKLDLAKAFIDMGDAEGARSSLQEVLEEGSDDQKAEATDLLNQIK